MGEDDEGEGEEDEEDDEDDEGDDDEEEEEEDEIGEEEEVKGEEEEVKDEEEVVFESPFSSVPLPSFLLAPEDLRLSSLSVDEDFRRGSSGALLWVDDR